MSEINAAIGTATARTTILGRTEFSALLPQVLAPRYTAACLLIAIVVVTDWKWAHAAGFTFAMDQIATHATSMVFAALAAASIAVISRIPRYAEMSNVLRLRELSVTLGWVVLMIVSSYATLVLQYLCVALHEQLVDTYLAAFDKAIGFQWIALFRWQMKHPQFSQALGIVYLTYAPQFFLTMLVLGLTSRLDDLSEFVLLFITTAILSILISAAFPASNPYFYFGVVDHFAASPWSSFYPLRNGTMTRLALDNAQGIVSIPSLHALDAVLFLYAVRHVKWLWPISAALNIVMIYAAVLCGAHYLADIVAGVLLASLAIVLWRRYARPRRSEVSLFHG